MLQKPFRGWPGGGGVRRSLFQSLSYNMSVRFLCGRAVSNDVRVPGRIFVNGPNVIFIGTVVIRSVFLPWEFFARALQSLTILHFV